MRLIDKVRKMDKPSATVVLLGWMMERLKPEHYKEAVEAEKFIHDRELEEFHARMDKLEAKHAERLVILRRID